MAVANQPSAVAAAWAEWEAVPVEEVHLANRPVVVGSENLLLVVVLESLVLEASVGE